MLTSVIGRPIIREAMHTAIAGALTKSVGSGFRIYDDRHAPKEVKRNTIRREALTVAQVSFYSFAIDTLSQNVLGAFRDKGLVNKRLLANLTRNKTLLKIAPISAGIFLAEAMGRKFAPRDIWEDPETREAASVHHADEPDDDDDEEEKVSFESRSFENSFFPEGEGLRLSGYEPLQGKPITFANNPAAPPPSPSARPQPRVPQGLPCANPFQRALPGSAQTSGLTSAFSL